jgi:hypothetical protein
MNFENITNQINALNYETNKEEFIQKYNNILDSINLIDAELNENFNDYENLTLEELMIILNEIDIKNTDIKYIKKMKKLVSEIEKKINTLEYINIE